MSPTGQAWRYRSMDQQFRKRPAPFYSTSDQQSSKRPRPNSTDDQPEPHTGSAAEKWFESQNETAKDVSYVDNDPPFYFKRPAPFDGNSICAMASDSSSQAAINPTGPTKSLLAQLNANDDNNSEDFRSVIDDLTIQNRRLKKKLKRYEKLHCSHLQEEKLFEVRIHGLAAYRRKELEELLRTFASSIEKNPGKSELEVLTPGQRQTTELSVPLKTLNMQPSPITSNSKQTNDSALASMSGQTGESPSRSYSFTTSNQPVDSAYASISGHTRANQAFAADGSAPACGPKVQSSLRQVKPCFQHIPESLPKYSLAMSDRTKSELVVTRLEQIFKGRRAADRRHNQSHQQQAVPQSDAESESSRLDAGEKRAIQEGSREAHILPPEADLKMRSMEASGNHAPQSHEVNDNESSNSRNICSFGIPEQRPTRPLDLDLHQAQLPSDNIKYIRHLGQASSNVESPDNIGDHDEWIYLNLLASMAQLHTLNVTLSFIRKAVSDLSTKFKLSEDGAKIRWLGGYDGTELSSESDESEDPFSWKLSETSRPMSKRGSLAGVSSREGVVDRHEPNTALPARISEAAYESDAGAKRRPTQFEESNASNELIYRPLFFQPTTSEQDDNTDLDTDSVAAESVDFATGVQSTSNILRKGQAKPRGQGRENGPIIFYNRAKFCTDLCGDPYGADTDKPKYRRLIDQPVGCDAALGEAELEDEVDKDRIPQPMDADVDSIKSDRSALDLEDLRTSLSGCISVCQSPLHFEASGLGGVQPDDNFVVNVQVQHVQSRLEIHGKGSPLSPLPHGLLRNLHRKDRNSIPALPELKNIPRSQGPKQVPDPEIISAVKTSMTPSSLPSPSYLCLPFSSPSGSDYDDNAQEIKYSASNSNYRASNHPPLDHAESQPPKKMVQSSLEDDGSESSCDSGSDDSSIDLLAHARVLDPDTIAAQEREFDFNSMQQLADLPAGSSAATGGGGSGRETPNGLALMKTRRDMDSRSVDEHESDDSESDIDDSD